MGMEYSPARRKRMRRRAQALRTSSTWGGPVTVRHVGDQVDDVVDELPAARQRAYGETKPAKG